MMYVVALLLFHNPDGGEIRINPDAITSLHSRHISRDKGLIAEGVGCLIRLNDGNFVSVKEDCHEVEQKLEGIK